MVKLNYSCFFTLLCCMIGIVGNAQEQTGTSSDTLTPITSDINLAEYLPPLPILIEAALANSPRMDMANSQIKMQEHGVALERKDWADLISAGADYRYYNLYRGTVSQDLTYIPAQESKGIQATAGIKIPLSYFVGRGDRLGIARAQMELAVSQREELESQIRMEVIEIYNQLLLTQRLLTIMTEAKESTALILEMSEEKFRDGQLNLDQLGNNTALKAKSAQEYETLLMEFGLTYSRLEMLVGVPLSKLQN